MWKRPVPNRLKSCRTVPKMAQNPQNQRPSIIKSAIFLPDASSITTKRPIDAGIFEKCRFI